MPNLDQTLACCCSVAQSSLTVTLWTAARQASLSFRISQSLLKFIIESVMPSNHLILCCPLLLLPSIFPIIRVFSKESALHIRYVAENTDSISFWRWGNIQEKSHQLCSPKDTQFTSAKVGQKIWISFICVIHLFCSVFFLILKTGLVINLGITSYRYRLDPRMNETSS